MNEGLRSREPWERGAPRLRGAVCAAPSAGTSSSAPAYREGPSTRRKTGLGAAKAKAGEEQGYGRGMVEGGRPTETPVYGVRAGWGRKQAQHREDQVQSVQVTEEPGCNTHSCTPYPLGIGSNPPAHARNPRYYRTLYILFFPVHTHSYGKSLIYKLGTVRQ